MRQLFINKHKEAIVFTIILSMERSTHLTKSLIVLHVNAALLIEISKIYLQYSMDCVSNVSRKHRRCGFPSAVLNSCPPHGPS